MDDIEHQIERSIAELATREQLADLLELLVKDYDENHFAWNNQDLRSYLVALCAYARGEGGYFGEMASSGDKPSWLGFADMLCAARAFVVDD